MTPPSVPTDFDHIDLGELLDVIAHLASFLTFQDDDDGTEFEAFKRAQRVLERYKVAT